ncbi:MAG: ATP-binding protein [Armatimonadetes bacterium]|nr:ATP-binding protein [Akkermansiaceae bacterium]
MDKLRPIIALATSGLTSKLPLKPRTSSLIVGPSGMGKSHLARELAKEAGVPFWEANVASWIVLGAKGGNQTLPSLVTWIANRKSGLIFLDELDKLTSQGEWTNAIRLEIHDLIDGRLPDGAIDVSGTTQMEELTDDQDKFVRKTLIKSEVEDKLKNSFMIVGAGAWQEAWLSHGQPIGFHQEQEVKTLAERIERKQIKKSITPEILQRFRNEILFLDPMTEADYLHAMISLSGRLPVNQRCRFVELAIKSIPSAVEDGLGMRVFEEVYAAFCSEIYHRVAGDPMVLEEILTRVPA